MHNGFVRVDNEKMSKSLGNFFTVREVLDVLAQQYHGDRARAAEVVRFFIVRAHYRSPLNYSDQHLEDANHALTRLYTALKGSDAAAGPVDWSDAHAKRFRDAMNDDFNTPEAVAVLFDLANELNKTRSTRDAALLKSLAGILGLLRRDPVGFLQATVVTVPTAATYVKASPPAVTVGMSPERIEQLIVQRTTARKGRNFGEADRIRKELLDAGVVLEDTAQGTTWRRT
jgi:cysteinyl-tRNA synthetase